MPVLGKEIHRCYDDLGPIHVFEDGNKRYLSFGGNNEQSCILKTDPAHLQYDYTRAMLLPLLFNPKPKRALLLGLGGGSLVNCLHRYFPELQLSVVELRQSVIDIAKQYFHLPKCKRLQLNHADAADYLRQHEPNDFDLIFSDIYHLDGVDELQLQQRFIDQCYNCLGDDGWLVLNCWKEHRSGGDILELLKGRFEDIRMCGTSSDNWVILAAKQKAKPDKKELKTRVKVLSEKLGFSISPQLHKLVKADFSN